MILSELGYFINNTFFIIIAYPKMSKFV